MIYRNIEAGWWKVKLSRQETGGAPQPVGCLAGCAASEMVSGPTVQLLIFITVGLAGPG